MTERIDRERVDAVHRRVTGYCGLDMRFGAETYARRRFADVYGWLLCHRAGWGDESPATDAYLARLQAFADRFCADDGSVEVTEHRVRVGGVMPLEPPQTWEFAFFGDGSESVRSYLALRNGATGRRASSGASPRRGGGRSQASH